MRHYQPALYSGLACLITVWPLKAQESVVPFLRRTMEAALGSWAVGSRIEFSRGGSVWYPGVILHKGFVKQTGHGGVAALVAELPTGEVVPLGCEVTRRLLSPLARVDMADTAALWRYAVELAQMDGRLPIGEALPITNVNDLPPAMRDAMQRRGRTIEPPALTEPSRFGGERDGRMFVLIDGSVLYWLIVRLGPDRVEDHVTTATIIVGQ